MPAVYRMRLRGGCVAGGAGRLPCVATRVACEWALAQLCTVSYDRPVMWAAQMLPPIGCAHVALLTAIGLTVGLIDPIEGGMEST